MRILIIVTNTDKYANSNLPTGLWLSELTHVFHSVNEHGYEITIASPKRGHTPIDPESLKPMVMDKISKNYWSDTAFRELLQHTKSLDEVSTRQFDCVYLAGGHGTMYDFPDDAILQTIIKKQYESNKMVAAICHGVGGLLNVKLSNGDYLIKSKKLTGFDWFEEKHCQTKNKSDHLILKLHLMKEKSCIKKHLFQ